MFHHRYRLLSLLGEGAMGAVYLVEDRLTGQRVALKKVLTQASWGRTTPQTVLDERRLALTHEFQSLASLRHPNIVSVLDYGFSAELQPYFTMEFLPEAQTILQAGLDQPVAEQLNLLLQMFQALAYLHRRQVLHRDLKPANVLVSGGRVKVLDFGLSVTEGNAGTPSGTLLYMAPELLQGESPTVTSDLYAAGIIAYELLTGQHPFAIGQVGSLLHAIFYQTPAYDLPTLPTHVIPLLRRLLAKSPQERYGSANEVIYALNEALGGTLVIETPETRESFLQAAKFVGREAEMGQLIQSLEIAISGQGQSWLIGGESGVGKSRLVEQVRIHALVKGTVVLRGQAVETGGKPYGIWLDLLRWLVMLTDVDDFSAAVLKAILPDIELLLEREVAGAPELEPRAAEARLLLVVGRLVRQCAQQQPLVILLEDVQWIGQNSLNLLNWLNRIVPALPLLLLATYRDDERPNLPTSLPAMQLIQLRRLPDQAIAALSESMLGHSGRNPKLLRFLEQETEGNTFFMVELVRALAEEAGQLDKIAQMSLPTTVFAGGIQQMVRRRLHRVGMPARPLLEQAAILGRQLDLALLQTLAPNLSLEQWLTHCAAAAILDVYDNQWRFAHDKLREGILHDLPPGKRQLLHHQVAVALETVYPDPHTFPEKLSYHWEMAGDKEKAGQYAGIAGAQAAARFANTEAIHYLTHALTLLPETASAERYDLFFAREQLYHLTGMRTAQVQDIATLQTLAHQMGDKEREAKALLRLIVYYQAIRHFQKAVESVQTLLQHIETIPQKTTYTAEAYLYWGGTLLTQNNYADAQTVLEQALIAAQQQPSQWIEASILHHLGILHWQLEQYAIARHYYQQAYQTFLKINHLLHANKTLANLAMVYRAQGDYLLAQNGYHQVIEQFRTMGSRLEECRALGNLGNLLLDVGLFTESRAYLEQALQGYQELNDLRGQGMILGNLSNLYLAQEDYVQTYLYSQQALERWQNIKEPAFLNTFQIFQGIALVHLNRPEEAAPLLKQIVAEVNQRGESRLLVVGLVGLLQAAIAQQDKASAMGYAEELLTRTENQPPFFNTTVRVYLACSRLFVAEQDPRARDVLEKGYRLLQNHAEQILDPMLCHSFLENVPAHRALRALWQNHNH